MSAALTPGEIKEALSGLALVGLRVARVTFEDHGARMVVEIGEPILSAPMPGPAPDEFERVDFAP